MDSSCFIQTDRTLFELWLCNKILFGSFMFSFCSCFVYLDIFVFVCFCFFHVCLIFIIRCPMFKLVSSWLCSQLEKLISKNYYLHKTAQEGFKAYVRAYASHKQKTIFDVSKLDITKMAKSFGFAVAPYVDIRILFNATATHFSVLECSEFTHKRRFFFSLCCVLINLYLYLNIPVS